MPTAVPKQLPRVRGSNLEFELNQTRLNCSVSSPIKNNWRSTFKIQPYKKSIHTHLYTGWDGFTICIIDCEEVEKRTDEFTVGDRMKPGIRVRSTYEGRMEASQDQIIYFGHIVWAIHIIKYNRTYIIYGLPYLTCLYFIFKPVIYMAYTF